VAFGLYGAAVGLFVALTVGELVWYLFRPAPAPETERGSASAAEMPPLSPVTVPPHSRLAVTASPRASVYPGEKNTIGVRVARAMYDGPVVVRFAAPVGLSAGEVVIPAGATSGRAEITAAATTPPGYYTLTATATGEAGDPLLSAATTVEVRVVAIPTVLPRLAVKAPKVQVYQRGKNTFAVRVSRGNFDGAVTIGFDQLPAGVAVPTVTIPPERSEAVAELTATATAKPGTHTIVLTARAGPNGAAADAEMAIEVLSEPRLPVDVVLVLDCTGSMQKTVDGVGKQFPLLAGELANARADARFALVGFQDTTLGQPLKIPKIDGARFSDSGERFGTLIQNQRLGGGGGDGESSLDGLAEAADCPFRESAVRVLVLVTDGGPKRIDGRVKSADEAIKLLKEKKIAQLHVAALPEHRKPFEPLWEGARGKYFDLKEANATGAYAKLMTDLGRAVGEALPQRPESKPAPSAAAPEPVLPPVGSVKPPALPSGAEPDEPKFERWPGPVGASQPALEASPSPEPSARGRGVLVAWALSVCTFTVLGLGLGQLTFLPGEKPALDLGAASYGAAVVVGLGALALGSIVFGSLAGPLFGRLAGGTLFGFGIGLMIPLAERWFRADLPPAALPITPLEPLELGSEPLPLPDPEPIASVQVVKPNITPPKPTDGCPGCGRVIPGETGKRYCMLCDATF
jgi:hypothetical protein